MVGSIGGLAVRQLRTRPLRSLLTGMGIVLGVGMVFAVLLLSGTIRNTFDELMGSLWGTKDLIVSPRGGLLPDADLQRIRDTPGVRDAAGMIGGTVVHLDRRGRAVKGAAGRVNLAGLPPQGETQPYDYDWSAGRWARGPDEIALERTWADNQHVGVGDTIAFGGPHGRSNLRVVGLFAIKGGLDFATEGYAFMEMGAARELLDMPHGWLQIAVRAQDRAKAGELGTTLERRLGAGAKVDTPSGLGDQIKDQLSALDVVLYFFAGVALFVGGFLILNSFSMTVAQRVRELGVLRTLGATRRTIRRSVVTEAVVLGAGGTIVGLAAGLGMALLLVAAIRGLGIPVAGIHVGWSSAVIAAALGVVAAAAGATLPARRAARISPVRAARDGVVARRDVPWLRIAAGVALFVPGAVWGGTFWFGNGSGQGVSAVVGIAMTMAMFVGMALCAPAIITPLIRLLAVPLRRLAPTGGRLAADAARRNPARTAATAIALTVGLSVVVVNSALSSSFVDSVNGVIERTYAADVIVRPVGATDLAAGSRTIGAQARRAVADLPGAGAVSAVTLHLAELPGLPRSQPYGLVEGYDPRTMAGLYRPGAEGISDADVPAALGRGEALVARVLADELDLADGGRIHLTGPHGDRRLRIAGIIDVFNELGGNTVVTSSATAAAIYGTSEPSRLLVAASDPARRSQLAAAAARLVADRYPQLESITTQDLKDEIDAQLRQQFALFNAIVAVAIIVSLLGVVNTLAMSVIERTREIGVLRALGSTRLLVRMTMVHEGVLMTVAGAAAGLLLGCAIGWFWVRSLGDLLPGISFSLPVTLIAATAVGAVALGTIAAALPARRAAKLDPVQALAYE